MPRPSLVDSDKVFIGSANLDPRSMKINTEMGLVVESPELNAACARLLAPDFEGGNAWNLRFDENGEVIWVSDDEVLRHNRRVQHATAGRLAVFPVAG